MIEKIKNEIRDLTPLFGNKEGVCVLRKEVFEILDKYKDKEIKFENGSSKFAIVKVPKLDVDNIKNYNQPDYKSAWNKLKKQEIYRFNESQDVQFLYVLQDMQELEGSDK